MRLGVIVGDQDPWRFFQDVYDDLASHYEVSLFRVRRSQLPILNERVNRRLLRHDVEAFMRRQDLVFFEWASGLLAFASLLPKRCHVIARLHRYEMFQWVPKINWAFVDKVIFVSDAMRARFIAQYPQHHQKTVVIPVGIDLEKFGTVRFHQSAGNIGTLCNISPRKRVYELILAYRDISRARHDLRLHIAGGTEPAYRDYEDAVKYLVEKLGLQDQVTFYGNVSKPWEWYRNIDVFVSNSYSEGMQVSLIEAMASGCYCLSHHWDGVEELLPEEYLFYTDSELQEKITSYLGLPEAAQQRHREKMRSIVYKLDRRMIQNQIRQAIEQTSMANSRMNFSACSGNPNA